MKNKKLKKIKANSNINKKDLGQTKNSAKLVLFVLESGQ